jgi:hypothetical protein
MTIVEVRLFGQSQRDHIDKIECLTYITAYIHGMGLFGLILAVETPTVLIYVISEKIRKKPWGQHHQTKLSMARAPAIIYISYLFSNSNHYGQSSPMLSFLVDKSTLTGV